MATKPDAALAENRRGRTAMSSARRSVRKNPRAMSVEFAMRCCRSAVRRRRCNSGVCLAPPGNAGGGGEVVNLMSRGRTRIGQRVGENAPAAIGITVENYGGNLFGLRSLHDAARNRRWRREAYVLRTTTRTERRRHRPAVRKPPRIPRGRTADTYAFYVRRLWVRLRRPDVRGAPIYTTSTNCGTYSTESLGL